MEGCSMSADMTTGVTKTPVYPDANMGKWRDLTGDMQKVDEKQDAVNHPAHYTAGGIECIDAIEAALTDEEFRGYCKGNALKYIWRERHKGGDESLAKAAWYMARMNQVKA